MLGTWEWRGALVAGVGLALAYLFGSGWETPWSANVELLVGEVPHLLETGLFALGVGLLFLGLAMTQFPAPEDERSWIRDEKER